MADPVSWFMIERGWKAVDSEGVSVGAVDEIVGDSTKDIFNGLAISTSFLGRPRYVPAEQVGAIVEGRVQLNLTKAQIEHLGEFDEPPTSAEVLPDTAGAVTRAEGRIEAPLHRHPTRMNVWRRLWLGLRRGR
jgi:uncharacterized protein DUF2171